MKKVRIYLMGGTIAATVDEAGNSVITDLAEYVRRFHELEEVVTIEVNSFSRFGGYETKIQDVVRLADELNRAVREDDLDGIVVVMGTNLMEEIAFARTCYLRSMQLPIPSAADWGRLWSLTTRSTPQSS